VIWGATWIFEQRRAQVPEDSTGDLAAKRIHPDVFSKYLRSHSAYAVAVSEIPRL
jgi:hypothetical protein